MCSIASFQFCSHISHFIVIAVVAFLLCSPVLVLADTVRPGNLDLLSFVRIDMKAPQTAPGLAAAFPLEERPLNILTEDKLIWYKENIFTEDFLEEYEFRSEAGRYVCYPSESRQPVRLKELVFPPYVNPLYKNVIRQSNTSVYLDADLDAKLDCFSVSAKVSKGRDLSSIFNLPFKSSGGGKLTNEYIDLDRMDLNLELDEEGVKSSFIRTIHDGSTHINDLIVEYYTNFVNTSNVTLKADFIIGSGSGRKIKGDETAQGEPVSTIDYRASFLYPPSYSPEAIAPWFDHASTGNKFEMRVWPFMPMKGWCDVSSFSEVGTVPSGGGKPATLVYLTPLSAVSEWNACLAMKKELMRALRTRWLFTEKPGFLAPIHHKNLTNALIRATPILWEYLAYGGVFKMLSGPNSADPVGDIVKDRLHIEDGAIYSYLVKPPKRAPSSVILPDYHRESYYFPFDRPADNYYATAVYRAWKIFKDDDLRSNLKDYEKITRNTRTKVDKKVKVVIDSIVDAIIAGFTEASGSNEAWAGHKAKILQMFPGETVQTILTKYGVKLSSLKSKYTDLEWIANCIEPYEDGTSAVASTVLTGTKSIASADIIDKCSLSSLIYPFAPLRNTPQGKRFLAFAKGIPSITNSAGVKIDAVDGISEICGMSFDDCPGEVLVIDVDKSLAVKLKGICDSFLNHNFTELSKGSSPSQITTWTEEIGKKAMYSDDKSDKKLGHYWEQTKYKKAVDEIIKTLKAHEGMGTDEIALVKKTYSTQSSSYVLKPYKSSSAAALVCSIFRPVKEFLSSRYSTGPTGKNFLKKVIEGLTNKPRDCPRLWFSKYVNGYVLSEDKESKVLFDVHTFVRRVKELATKLEKPVSFKTKGKVEFSPVDRRDYNSSDGN